MTLLNWKTSYRRFSPSTQFCFSFSPHFIPPPPSLLPPGFFSSSSVDSSILLLLYFLLSSHCLIFSLSSSALQWNKRLQADESLFSVMAAIHHWDCTREGERTPDSGKVGGSGLEQNEAQDKLKTSNSHFVRFPFSALSEPACVKLMAATLTTDHSQSMWAVWKIL